MKFLNFRTYWEPRKFSYDEIKKPFGVRWCREMCRVRLSCFLFFFNQNYRSL